MSGYRIVRKYRPWGWMYVVQGKALGLFWLDQADERTFDEARELIEDWEMVLNSKTQRVWP